MPMSLAAFKLLRYLSISTAGDLRRTPHITATRAETESLLRAYLRHILERDPRSLVFLDDVRQMLRTSGSASVGSSATRYFARGDTDENDRDPPGAR